MKRVLFSILIISCCFTLIGCGKKDNNSQNAIVGKWAHDSFVYTFNKDGTCSYDAAGTLMKCTYKIDKDKLSILYEGDTTSFDTTFSIDGNKLNVKDSFGDDTIYEKK